MFCTICTVMFYLLTVYWQPTNRLTIMHLLPTWRNHRQVICCCCFWSVFTFLFWTCCIYRWYTCFILIVLTGCKDVIWSGQPSQWRVLNADYLVNSDTRTSSMSPQRLKPILLKQKSTKHFKWFYNASMHASNDQQTSYIYRNQTKPSLAMSIKILGTKYY